MKHTDIREIVPEIRKYVTQKIGGSEVIRAMRDTLSALGMQGKKKRVPYKHQRVVKDREEQAKKTERREREEQGVTIKAGTRERKERERARQKKRMQRRK